MTWELFAVFLGSSIRLATPLLLAGIGEMVSERAGVLNMSIEGMMLMSALPPPLVPGQPAIRWCALLSQENIGCGVTSMRFLQAN